MLKTRTEQDSLGSYNLPFEALFGIQTQRATSNFLITGVKLSHFPEFIVALAMVKLAAVKTNFQLNVINAERTKYISEACQKIIDGHYHDQFVVDMIQGGAGTSTNMNANEVIANIANMLAGHPVGEYSYIHPIDHVNCSQSTNDVYPTAIRIAILKKCAQLIEEQSQLAQSFYSKAKEFSNILKVGRTQLQDAVPMTLGREFASFGFAVNEEILRIIDLSKVLKTINLGGTAIGTGINTPKNYSEIAVDHLAQISGYELKVSNDLIDASSDMGSLVSISGLLRRVAIKLSKICNDLRLLSSGPRAGFGEIILPAVQAGSSIMPGKINPVIPEVVSQVAYQVVGNDLTITMAAEAGQLQLNAMEPVIVYNLLNSINMMGNAMYTLRINCINGISADRIKCEDLFSKSLILTTALVPILGYDVSADIAKTAQESGKTIKQVVLEEKLMTENAFTQAIENYTAKSE